jgi:hypothetical protein
MNRYPTFVPLTKQPAKVRSLSLEESSSKFNAECQLGGVCSDRVLINRRMSSARQAVHRADNFTGFGKRPDLTPSHQHVLPCILQPLVSVWLIITRFASKCLGERRSEPVVAIWVSQRRSVRFTYFGFGQTGDSSAVLQAFVLS